MATVIIIAGFITIVFIIIVINAGEKSKAKNDLQDLLAKIHKEIFPNGTKEIDEGTKELLRILNYNIDKKRRKIFS